MRNFHNVYERADAELHETRQRLTEEIDTQWEEDLASRKGERAERLKHRRMKDRGPHKATTRPGDSVGEWNAVRWRLQARADAQILSADVEETLAGNL